MYPCWSAIRVHLQSILASVYAGNENMTNIPNIFYWHGPNNSCSRGRIHFYTPWTEQAFCIFSLLNSLSRLNIYWHIGELNINNTTMWLCQPFFEPFKGCIIKRSGNIVMRAFNLLYHLFDYNFSAFVLR